MLSRAIAIYVVFSAALYGQTQVDLRAQGKDVDFAGANFTRPVQTGVTLPVTCLVGAMFFQTNSPAGSNLYGCTSPNQWTLQTGGGSLSISQGGTPAGSGTDLNFIGGFGMLSVVSSAGAQINVQQGVDTSVIPSKNSIQSGGAVLCLSASGSATTYTCAMSPTLTGYTSGMVLNWIPDVAGAGSATTLNVDTLGPVPLVEADGATTPTSADILAGRMYALWYDGASFRLMAPPLNAASSGAQPVCTAALRGLIWQTLGGTGVKDTVSVCAKDSSDVSAWRSIY
jgi:hypothetical protein